MDIIESENDEKNLEDKVQGQLTMDIFHLYFL